MGAKYGSDIVVDLLQELDIDYIALNPGASIRSLHESIVNYGGNKRPEIILCCHEEIAVSLAHGYAKAAHKPMAAGVHNILGLLNSSLAIYIDWIDQTPILILGGTGPVAIEKRRPWIDWIHTALVQGNVVRDYVKWDDQPASMDSLPESFYRGYRAAVSEPKGPVYICLDAGLQAQETDEGYEVPEFSRFPVSSSLQADPAALQKAAGLLVQAERPLVLVNYLGRNPVAVTSLIELAELLSLPVIDLGSRFNFPNTHPLDLSGGEGNAAPAGSGRFPALQRELLEGADLILGLDVGDFSQPLSKMDSATQMPQSRVSATTKIVHIGLHELLLRGWSQNVGKLQPMDLSITADTSLALPSLIAACKEELAKGDTVDRKQRFGRLQAEHEALRQEWREMAANSGREKPIALSWLARELGEVIKNEDWVLVNRTLNGWSRRLWDWASPHQWVGTGAGCGLSHGLGHSVGAALANKGTGRICIDLQPDGDMLFTPSALWTAASHRIPLLVVMFNNRSYYNSEEHQRQTAQARGRDTTTRGIGTRLDNPPVDFAAMARSFGVYSEGPIDEPAAVRPALERALRYVKEQGSCALVDVITQPR